MKSVVPINSCYFIKHIQMKQNTVNFKQAIWRVIFKIVSLKRSRIELLERKIFVHLICSFELTILWLATIFFFFRTIPLILFLNRIIYRMDGWSREFVGFLVISKRVKNDHSKSSYAKVKVNYAVCSLKHQSNQLQPHKSGSHRIFLLLSQSKHPKLIWIKNGFPHRFEHTYTHTPVRCAHKSREIHRINNI